MPDKRLSELGQNISILSVRPGIAQIAKIAHPPPHPILQCTCKQRAYSDLWVIVMQAKDLSSIGLIQLGISTLEGGIRAFHLLCLPPSFLLCSLRLCVQRLYLCLFPLFFPSPQKCTIMHFPRFLRQKLHYNALFHPKIPLYVNSSFAPKIKIHPPY